jgi:beta-phosphoglucomutase
VSGFVRRPAAVLWDLDGTLADSGDYHWRSWRDTLRLEGIELDYQQFLDSFGQKNDRILTNWLGPDTAADTIRRIGDAKEELYREFARAEGLVPLAGAVEWVRRLHGDGWKQAIASSAPRANVEVMLEAIGLASLMDAIVSADDVSRGKPDPQVFLRAAERLAVPPDACVVVEDAAAGVEAGRRAGMKTIGVNVRAPLAADIYVRSLADLSSDAFEALLRSRPT